MTTGRINQVTTLAHSARSQPASQPASQPPGVARSVTDRTRSPCRSRVVQLSLYRTFCRRPVRPASAYDDAFIRSMRVVLRKTRDGYFKTPSEHSLRGRNTQDCRIRNERKPVRTFRSGSLTQTDDRACRNRTGRAPLGRALSTASFVRKTRRRPVKS